MLTAWPYIYDELGSDARLEVYYGFTPGFVRHAKRTMSDYDSWRARMDALLQQPGVSYIGLVPPAALARAYAGAGFALYPTSYPETSCVAMMKAMVRCGSIAKTVGAVCAWCGWHVTVVAVGVESSLQLIRQRLVHLHRLWVPSPSPAATLTRHCQS